MSAIEKLLEKMATNQRDWRIEDLLSIAGKFRIEVRNHGGSHHVFSVPGIEEIVTVPAHRPIKPVYIRQFLSFVQKTREMKHERQKN